MFDRVFTATLNAPQFSRIDEYFGAWLYEPERFMAQLAMLQRADIARHAAAPQQSRSPYVNYAQGKGDQNIAIISAVGTLMKQASSYGGTSTIQLRRDIRQAANDSGVQAILLAIDSPGGTVAGTADLAADVRAAAKKKPVWAHIDDLGASAAYWLASQADAIYANSPTALVGSIGTVMTVYDYSAAAEKEGVKTLVFATGPLKGAGAPGTVVTDEQRAYFQGIVDDAQTHFDAAVKSGRGFSAAQLAAVRTGGVFGATQAKELGLIDGIRSLESTVNALVNAK